jgi:hypothetical protein
MTMGAQNDMQSDAKTWEMIEKATAQYDQYQRLQRVGDLVAVLRQEHEAVPQAPRIDLPLSLTPGH